jgi:Uncharacterized protein conserved in bacteria (DUF2059)
MLLLRLFVAVSFALAAPAFADTPATQPVAEVTVATLAETMHLGTLFAVLRDEGIAYGQTLEADMFPGGGGPGWTAAVDAIYDAPALTSRFTAVLDAELSSDPDALGQIIAFFATDLGQRIVGLEIDARRAFLDEAAEEAARVASDTRFADRDPRADQLRRFIEAGDLIEMNVAGSLSGNLAFMQGMSASGAYGAAVPEDQMLSDVWAQEDQVREDTTSWLYAYLGLAYQPLTDDEMQAYIDFSESPAGKRLNAALFTAFDSVFRQVSTDLGHAAGLAMLGRDI